LACTGRVGVVGFCMGGTLAFRTAAHCDVDAAGGYYGGGISNHLGEGAVLKGPVLLHFGEMGNDISLEAGDQNKATTADKWETEVFVYSGAGHGFNCDERASFDKRSAMIAHQRTLKALHHAIGPRVDLNELWDEHCRREFDERNVEATMETM